MDDGWHSPEILRLQHYELLIDAVVKKLPKLLAWLESIVAKRYTRTALSSKAGPGNWDIVDDVAVEALTAADLPETTPRVITELAWTTGHDPSIQDGGTHPDRPEASRPNALGTHLRWCLAMAKKISPIYMQKLFAAEAHTDMTSMRSALHRLHFDHCLRKLKGQDIQGTR